MLSLYGFPFLLAMLVSYVLTPHIKKLAFKIGAVDKPDNRKVHKKIMPRLGGLAIYIAFMIGTIASLEITKDGVVFCTLKFNAQGQLIGIAFAPSRDGELRTMQAAEMTANGWQFTVTGLNQASKYGYTLDALNAGQQSIKHYEGEFYTDGYTGLERLTIDHAQCTVRKFIKDNQLYIFRGKEIYNAAGVEL